MNALDDYFPDLDGMGERWEKCWKMSSRLYAHMTPQEKLAKSLAVYISQELDELDGDENPKDRVLVISAALAAASKTGTHSKAAFTAAFEDISGHRKKRFLDKVDTRFKRLALMTFPFFAVIALYSLAHAINHSDDTPLSFFLFGMAAVLCLLIAFTRLGDWINARHD